VDTSTHTTTQNCICWICIAGTIDVWKFKLSKKAWPSVIFNRSLASSSLTAIWSVRAVKSEARLSNLSMYSCLSTAEKFDCFYRVPGFRPVDPRRGSNVFLGKLKVPPSAPMYRCQISPRLQLSIPQRFGLYLLLSTFLFSPCSEQHAIAFVEVAPHAISRSYRTEHFLFSSLCSLNYADCLTTSIFGLQYRSCSRARTPRGSTLPQHEVLSQCFTI
jgi:hypothetical protein